jgi:hypothetical protein
MAAERTTFGLSNSLRRAEKYLVLLGQRHCERFRLARPRCTASDRACEAISLLAKPQILSAVPEIASSPTALTCPAPLAGSQ